MFGTVNRPFGDEPLPTIPLKEPPLLRVLVQIRFAQVLAVADEAFVGAFQQAIIDRFPRARSEVEIGLVMAGGDPAPSFSPSKLWKFHSLDEHWVVTLGSTFVALETSAYAGNEEFFALVGAVLDATTAHIKPPLADRVGVRYTQRLDAPGDMERIGVFMRPEILGLADLTDDGAEVQLVLTQSQFALSEGVLSARWGILPAGGIFDPTLPAIDTPSWIFDIDTYQELSEPFDPQTLGQRAFDLSRHQYRFFRWAVTPAFLLRFGADPTLVDSLEREAKK